MNLLSPAPIGIVGGPAASPSGILADIAAGVASGSDLHDLLARFLRPIIDIAGAAAGAVRAAVEDGQGMRLVASLDLPEEALTAELAITSDCGVCGVAAAAGQPRWAGAQARCGRHGASTLAGVGYRRVLAVPLRHRSRSLGVYTLFFVADTEPAAEVQTLLRAAGELLGLALDNARLERENLRVTVADERRAMAADVHDSIGQSLAYVKMRLPLLHDALLRHDDALALKYHEDVRQAVGDAHASLREILTHFRTRMDPKGLPHALRELQAGYLDRHRIHLTLDNRAADLELSVEQEVQVFHIVQEALANVARHSQARQAHVAIDRVGGELRVAIEDDGAGLPAVGAAAEPSHFGFEIMRERARRLGGTLSLQARDGGGTRVCLSIPVAPGGRSAMR